MIPVFQVFLYEYSLCLSLHAFVLLLTWSQGKGFVSQVIINICICSVKADNISCVPDAPLF